jgi:hypothetical protein
MSDLSGEWTMMVAKNRERLAVSTETTEKFDMERFSPRKLNEVDGKEKYRVEIKNRFTALESLGDDGDVDISRAWETIN